VYVVNKNDVRSKLQGLQYIYIYMYMEQCDAHLEQVIRKHYY